MTNWLLGSSTVAAALGYSLHAGIVPAGGVVGDLAWLALAALATIAVTSGDAAT